MKRFACAVAVVVPSIVLGACSSGMPHMNDQGNAGPTTVITLGLDQAGHITVSQDTARVPIRGIVRWASADPSAVWVVVLADSTPMVNHRQAFNGGGPPAQAQGAVGSGRALIGNEYKYWVFYPDGNGGYVQKDPKLVIIDDQGADSATSRQR